MSKTKSQNKTSKNKDLVQNKNCTKNLISPQNASQIYSDSDDGCRFELELCWCIQSLELTLNSGKLNQKQAEATTKTLNILKNASQPLIKKRQIMRSTFGDYRAKMIEEEKKLFSGTKQIKFDPKTKQKEKSVFIKRSAYMERYHKDGKFHCHITKKIDDLNISDSIQSNSKENIDRFKNSKDEFVNSQYNFTFNFTI